MKAALQAKNLWSLVKGTRVKPTEMEDQPAWEKDAEQAAGLMGLYTGSQALHFVKDSDNPVEMWKDLGHAFNAPRPGHRMIALRDLLNVCQQPEETLDQLGLHIQHFHQEFISLPESTSTIRDAL